MTFTPTIEGIVDTNNTNTNLSQAAWNVRSNSIVSATTTATTGSFVLDSGASAVDDTYNNLVIEINLGLGINNFYLITDYVGSTKTCTISGYVEILPDSTSTYIIHTYSGICQNQTQNQQFKTIKLGTNASSNDDFHNNCFLKVINGGNINQIKRILDYDGTTKVANIDSIFTTVVTNNFLYIIIGENGTAQSGTSTTIVLEASHGHSTVDDYYNNFYIEITSGTGSGQTKEITDYVGSTLTCTVGTWDTNPDNTSIFNIYSGWGAPTFTDVSQFTETTYSMTFINNEKTIIFQQTGLTNDDLNNNGKYIENESSSPSLVHTLVVVSKYFKIKLISFGTTINGATQVLLHNAKNKHLTSFVEESITKNNDCELVRSVITGKTSSAIYKNVRISDEGDINVEITNPTTAFGEVQISDLVPVAQINFPYYKNTDIIEEFTDH
jgi:hypothetical protein